jgi:hypothetical protein
VSALAEKLMIAEFQWGKRAHEILRDYINIILREVVCEDPLWVELVEITFNSGLGVSVTKLPNILVIWLARNYRMVRNMFRCLCIHSSNNNNNNNNNNNSNNSSTHLSECQ